MKSIFKGIAILIVILAVVGCGNQSQVNSSKDNSEKLEKVYLNLGAAGQNAASYVYMVSLADSIQKNTDERIQVNVVETGAAMDNTLRMQKGQVDFILGDDSITYSAINGTEDFEENQFPEIRNMFLWLIAPQPWQVTVDSGIETIEDMSGRHIAPSGRGTGSEKAAEKVMDKIGVEPDWFRGTFDDIISAARDRRIEGFVKSGVQTGPGSWGPDAVGTEIHSNTPLKLIGFSEKQQSIILNELPEYPLVTIPKGNFYDNQEDIVTYALVLTVATSTELSEDVAYEITKAMIEGKDSQVEKYPSVEHVNYIEDSIQYLRNPLHAGAVRYFQEKGYDVPKHLIPPEMK